jgi:hypothetical protein
MAGAFREAGRGYTDISKPNGYGSGSSADKASTSLNLSSDQQPKARELLASGLPRSEVIAIVLEDYK